MATGSPTVYVTDLDGTLLGKDAKLSRRSRSGLRMLLESGLLLTVASARSVVAMQSILWGLRIPLPVIEFNGALISDLATGRHLVTNSIEPGLARRAYDLVVRGGCVPFVSSFNGFSDGLHYRGPRNPGMEWYLDDRDRNQDRRLTRTPDLASALSEEVVCLTVIDSPETVGQLHGVLLSELGGDLSLRRFRNPYLEQYDWLTMHDRRAAKDRALRVLLEMSKLEEAEVVAFGDGDNDVSLLSIAHRGIAVADACPELKSVAAEIVGPSYEDSVVRFLENEWEREDVSAVSAT